MRIKVIGNAGEGKITIAKLINQCLIDNGFDSNIQENSNTELECLAVTDINKTIPVILRRNVKITIETVQAKRSGI